MLVGCNYSVSELLRVNVTILCLKRDPSDTLPTDPAFWYCSTWQCYTHLNIFYLNDVALIISPSSTVFSPPLMYPFLSACYYPQIQLKVELTITFNDLSLAISTGHYPFVTSKKMPTIWYKYNPQLLTRTRNLITVPPSTCTLHLILKYKNILNQ